MGTTYLDNYDHHRIWALKRPDFLEVRLYETPERTYAAFYKSAREVGKFDIIAGKITKSSPKDDHIQYKIGEQDLFPGRIIKIMLKKIDNRYNRNNETVCGVAYIKYDPSLKKLKAIGSKEGYRLIKEEPQWWNNITKSVSEPEPEFAGPGM